MVDHLLRMQKAEGSNPSWSILEKYFILQDYFYIMVDITIFTTQNITNITNIIPFIQTYASSLPSLILQGDVAAISIGLMLFFASLVVINKITSALLALIKRLIFFIITGLAFYYFLTGFFNRLTLTGLTTGTLIFGLFGIVLGMIGLGLSIYLVFRGFKEQFGIDHKVEKIPEYKEIVEKPEERKADIISELRGLKKELSLQMIRQEKNLLAILVYLIIAEFGIFSSPTMVAPTPQIGMVFFGIFIVGTLFFVRQTYKNIRLGLIHLFIALIFGLILSLILGHFWGGTPWETLISLEYFATNSLVALITGIAVALFMSSR